jgi:hypothetical protein
VHLAFYLEKRVRARYMFGEQEGSNESPTPAEPAATVASVMGVRKPIKSRPPVPSAARLMHHAVIAGLGVVVVEFGLYK